MTASDITTQSGSNLTTQSGSILVTEGQQAGTRPPILIMPTPVLKRVGGVFDVIPNLLITTLALSAASAFPPGNQASASAPPPNYEVRAHQQPNTLIEGIPTNTATTLLPGIQYDCLPAPSIKYQLRVDPIPNLLGKQLIQSTGLPFHPVDTTRRPELPQSLTADIYSVSYMPPPAPAVAPSPSALVMPTPQIKVQVFAEPGPPNVLIHGITAQPPIPIAMQTDTSRLQVKYEVYDLNSLWFNSILPENIPKPVQNPFVNDLHYQYLSRTDVFDFNYIFDAGQLVRGIPPSGTPPPPPPPPPSGEGMTKPGGRVILEPKYQGETLPEPCDFISKLSTGETITNAFCVCKVYSGADGSPASVLSGAPSISGTIITQEVTGGVLGCTYELLFTAYTSFGNIVEISAYLSIVPDLV